MSVRPTVAIGTLLLTAAAWTCTSGIAAAQSVDPYSGESVSPVDETRDDDVAGDEDAGDDDAAGVGNESAAGNLPFTGGEIVLLGTVAAGALASGTALVVAGRRQRSSNLG